MVDESKIQLAILEHTSLAEKIFEKASKEFWAKGATRDFLLLKTESEKHKFAAQALNKIISG